MSRFLSVALLGTLVFGQAAFAQSPLPDRRSTLVRGIDLPGGDLRSLFNTTLEACEKACLSDSACQAFTYNTRNGSCFPKSDLGTPVAFEGAISGTISQTSAAAQSLAKQRMAELGFLPSYIQAQLTSQAQGLSRAHVAGPFATEELRASALAAEREGQWPQAAGLWGATANRSDRAEDWEAYARALTRLSGADNTHELRLGAITAAANAYLRAETPANGHNALTVLATALENNSDGRQALAALRAAQKLQPRDDTATDLARLSGLYGFRIEGHEVKSDLASPQLCAEFTEGLIQQGVDYTPYVQLPATGLTVEVQGWSSLCIGGWQHGQRASVTFREGLPSADGQSLEKSVAITAYIRDRKPQVYFASGGFVLPRSGAIALPVTAVNASRLELDLYRISDRSILRSIQQDWFSRPLDEWDGERFTRDIGEKLWSGTAEVASELNRDVTTRLPLTEALADKGAGLYALKARLEGVKEDYDNLAAWQWFLVSDLGMTTFSGVDGLTVVLRALGDAGPKAGVEVQLIARSNRVLGTAITDAEGVAHFPADLTRGTGASQPALVTATEGQNDFAMLSLTDPEFDLSDRGVEGREPSPPIDLFLATDRGAYRAGETLHATALARDAQGRALSGLPLTALLRRPDGVEHTRQRITDTEGGFAIAMPLAGNAPRGSWKLEILADPSAPPLGVQSFLVEDFLPERIDFTLTLPEGELRTNQPTDVQIEAKYLFGAPGAGLTGEGEVVLRAANGLAAYPGYVFGPATEPYSPRMESLSQTVVTDEDGRATLRLTLPQPEAQGRPLEAELRLRLAEGSGRPVERRITRPVAPEAALIGLKPAFEGAVREGSEVRFEAIAVGAPSLAANWSLDRIETRYQWYQLDGEWNWEPMTTRQRVTGGQVTLGDQPIALSGKVDWGQYALTIATPDGKALTSYPFTAGWYAAADTRTSPDMLELSLDKPHYNPGEVAKLRIVPRAAGQALIAVLSNRVIALKTVAVPEGETVIELPVTDDWGAGVYLTASVLRPMEEGAARLPGRALGLAHAAIAPGERQLSATILAPSEAAPRAPLEVAVKVDGLKAGEKAYATLAAIDVGILNLTGYKAPDPSAHYFGQRKLGVGIRDIYGRLIDGMNGVEGQVRSGGDAGRAQLQAPPPTEELVAWFEGPIEVDAEGIARTSFALPSFNGTVKVMAVVWSDSGIGQAQGEVLVRDPVVVTASLPRFLQPGDESRLLLEIVHATGPTGRMGLDVTANGAQIGASPSGVDLNSEGAKAVFSIPVKAGPDGLATLSVRLTTPDGKVLDKPLMLPIQTNDPLIQAQSQIQLAAGQSMTLGPDLFAGFRTGTTEALISAGAYATLDAPGLLAALDAYPWGCSEQLTSRALPLLHLEQMATTLARPEAPAVQQRVAQSVERLLLNQNSEGAFGLWSAWSDGDQWLTAYVTDFLSQARAAGHAVPDRAFRAALDNLRSTVNYAGDFENGGEALAYALMVLAREGAAAIGDLRYYADVKAEAFSTPLAQAQLAAALAYYGDQPRADALFAKAGKSALNQSAQPEAQLYRADYGTGLRDTAGVLALALAANSTAIDRAALTESLSQRIGQAALSTQEQAWILLAAQGLAGMTGNTGLIIDGQPAQTARFDPSAGQMTLENRSAQQIALTISAFGKPEGTTQITSSGYQITRRYFTLEGKEADITEVKAGTRLATVLEVTPLRQGEGRLIIEDPLPAGFEIDNPNLMRGGQIAALDWLSLAEEVRHSEFRQDRFMTAIDWREPESFRLAYIVRAVSPGQFHHPAAMVEDMYRPVFRATTASGRVTITE